MYCVISDIKSAISEDILIQLTDDAGTGEVDDYIVTAAIEWAEELIDGYLRGRYTLPLETPVPKPIAKLCVDLASYILFERRRGLEMPESLTDKYKANIKILEHLQSGKIVLGVETGTSVGAGEYLVSKSSDDRVFDSDTMEMF